MKRNIIVTSVLSILSLTTLMAQPTLVEKVVEQPGKIVIPFHSDNELLYIMSLVEKMKE